MSVQITNPKFQIFDSNGVPLAGGKVYTYLVGTTTLTTTYSDVNLTPNSNPILLNERGECVIYSLQGLKIKVTDKDDVTVWTMDDIGMISLGDYYLSNYASLATAITAIGSNVGTLHITTGTWPVSANLTVPSTLTLQGDGGVLSIATGVTLTVNGPFNAGLIQVFSCTGTGAVVFGDKVGDVFPEWWYSGTGDFAPALHAAIDSRTSSNSILLSAPSYAFTTGVTVGSDTHIRGLGMERTAITFTPAATATLFDFVYAPGGVSDSVWRSSLRDLSMTGSGTQTKTFVRMMDTRQANVEWLKITDTTASSSIGILYKGRDTSRLQNLWITADRPIVIGANPTSASQKIVGDGVVFGPNLLTSCNDTMAGKNIEILGDADLYLPSLRINGWYANKGQYGLYWNDTVSTSVHRMMHISDFRFEQFGGDNTAIAFYISPYTRLAELFVENISAIGVDGSHRLANLLYLKNVIRGTFIHCSAANFVEVPVVAVDTGGVSTCDNFTFINCQWTQGKPPTMTGMRKVFGTQQWYGTAAALQRNFEQWTANTNVNYDPIFINGAKVWHFPITLADAATKILPLPSADNKVATVTVTASKTAGGSAPVGGVFAWGKGAGSIISSSQSGTWPAGTNYCATADTAGKVCLFVSGSDRVIKNNLGYEADFIINITWSPTPAE